MTEEVTNIVEAEAPADRTNQRNRPFLMINIIQRPATGVRTDKPGWAKITGSWSMFERIEITDRVRRRDMINAAVIIDIIHGKVVKTRVEHSENEIVEYYLGKYKDECKTAVNRWISAQAKNFMANEGKRILAEQATKEEEAPASTESGDAA